jgi:hypothetical protein
MHSYKFLSVGGGHLGFMNIPPRKEEGSYAYCVRVGGKLLQLIEHKEPPSPAPHDLCVW